VHPILFRLPIPGFGEVPLYSYGVMLALSLIVGWYLTLGLAERDRLPVGVMANCYVVTAIAAVAGSRILYVLTNLDEFDSVLAVLEFRSGGLVAYGGFLGGFAGSWAYLAYKKVPLLPWADVAVPSLASGLAITRIGCYLYGCDFGKPLAEGSPTWLQKLGSFPHWPPGTVEAGRDGSPAWVQHVHDRGLDIGAATSLPVHPTQLYESLVGLALLAFLLRARSTQRFRGQIFLWFTFLYGAARFSLELVRDDAERGSIPPALPAHVLISGSYFAFAFAYAFGIAPTLRNRSLRAASQALAFVPAVFAYLELRPGEFAAAPPILLSTSQFVGLLSGVAAATFFGLLYRIALENPRLAMTLPDFSHLESESDQPTASAAGDKNDGASDTSDERGDSDDSPDGGDSDPSDRAAPEEQPKRRDEVT
jgi:phosphatidylglycerol---prolipoprotein diacylglyceryl transferase